MAAGHDHRLVFDWNRVMPVRRNVTGPVGLHDETLRDGLQSPGVRMPTLDERVELLRLMSRLGLKSVDLGFPATGGSLGGDVERLLRVVHEEALHLEPVVAARTVLRDLRPAAELAQRAGCRLEVAMFIGSSPIRMFAESWTLEDLQRRAEEAVSFAVREGLRVLFVTEDTTRSRPEHLEAVFGAALRSGAAGICLADTVGHATPEGARSLVTWARTLVERVRPGARIDWHGHNDRGLAVANCLAAAEAGADRLHATALGVGERVGNAAMEQVLVNLRLVGWWSGTSAVLAHYCAAAAAALGVEVPPSAPVVGRDAFRTATGVHAAALLKARERDAGWLADRVYSSIPAAMVGRRQEVVVGPMSGVSNVRYWLRLRGLDEDPATVDRVLQTAKREARQLADDEIEALVRSPAREVVDD